MQKPVRIAPSILSADFAKLGEEVRAIDKAGADYIHLDVMDGHFVPNITIGPSVVKALRGFSGKPFDAHLMISPADPYLKNFAEAGADFISIHPEAEPDYLSSLKTIKDLGVKAGIVINPETSITVLDDVMDIVDLILVMTVNPGFGGQSFIESQLGKIEVARILIDTSGRDIDLEVDGGITPETAKFAIAAGADLLVAGTSTFTGGPEKYAENISALRG